MFNLGNANRNLLSVPEEKNKYYEENYDIDLNNTNDSHSIIVNNIINPKKILDVGCGCGYIGKKVKQLYPDCIVHGIEIDNVAAKYAEKIYDKVYECSIVDNDNEIVKEFLNSKEKYNYIILADILEHLPHSDDLIEILSKKLVNDGKILISIPNFAHINIIEGLLNDAFNYNKTGIIDETHVRFFTETSFIDYIENINKKYNINLYCKCISKTYAKENDENDKYLYSIKGNDLYVFQNIFEITISDKKNSKKKNSKVYNKIDELYNNYINLSKVNDENNLLIEQLKNENNELKQELAVKNEKLERIYNSKAWKATKPIRYIKRKIKK